MDSRNFRRENIGRMRAVGEWLRRSIDACRGQGSSAFYAPLMGWAAPYPETTGYLIETLIRYGSFAREASYVDLAVRLANWLISLQNPDGSFHAGLHTNKPAPASVFNTAQALFGLVAADEINAELQFMAAARRAAGWLCALMDADGRWSRFNYRDKSFSPAYYSRVAWPLLIVWKKCGDASLRDCAIRSLHSILERQNANASFRDWGFRQSAAGAFTHTIAYTIEGLLQSGLLLGGVETEYWKAGYRAAEAIFRRFEVQKRIGGTYDQQWKGNLSFSCITGNCQLALCWLVISEETNDFRFLNSALKILDVVHGTQYQGKWFKELRGAVPGSKPLWGPYMRFRYPGWAAKFYLDAMMSLERQMERIERVEHASSVDCRVLVQ